MTLSTRRINLLEFDEDEDIDYWYDDFEHGADIVDDTAEDGFVDKNYTIPTKVP
jgi:hypothetical protein